MKKILIALIGLALALSGCVCSKDAASTSCEYADSFNAASFNILYHADNELWEKRRDSVAEVVKFHNFDIVGMQEVAELQLEFLQSKLPEYGHIINTPHYKDGFRKDGKRSWKLNNVTFYKKDRFELLEQGTFWFGTNPYPADHKTTGFGCDPKIKQNRFCIWGKFKDKKSGEEFYFFNMHWSHNSKDERAKSGELLVSQIKKIAGTSGNAIAVADFNANIKEASMQTLIKSNLLVDSKSISKSPHYGPKSTFHGYRNSFHATIDHIMVSPKIKVLSHATVSDNFDGLYPSDHMPIVAKVLLK